MKSGLLTDFVIDVLPFIYLIIINKHWFFLFNALDKYINSLPYEKQQFTIKWQGLEFYAIYAINIVKNKNAFANKVKDKNSLRAFKYGKKDLNKLIKSFWNYNITYKQKICKNSLKNSKSIQLE